MCPLILLAECVTCHIDLGGGLARTFDWEPYMEWAGPVVLAAMWVRYIRILGNILAILGLNDCVYTQIDGNDLVITGLMVIIMGLMAK